MASALQQLVAFTGQANPSFVCTNGGRSGNTKRIFVARLSHVLNAPASAQDLALLRSMLGALAAQFEELYAAHDGFVLYRDSLSDAAGIEALPIAQWSEAGDDMRQWFEHLDDESDPDHIRTGVAFATAPQSGNYFVMPVEGPNAGKVFYADHDGWYESHFANNFGEFIARVTSNPAHLLSEELGCYARYSDGKTSIQWIPESYNVG
jgi:SMI1-KNR4 cell-wall